MSVLRAEASHRLFRLRRGLLGLSVPVLLALLAVPFLLSSAYWMRISTETLLFAGLAVSWTLFSGFSGYVSFGHAVFFGLGAYTVGIATTRYEMPLWLAISVAPVLTGILALFVGLLTLRLRGHYFAIATLGIAEAVRVLVEWGRGYTKGSFGFSMPLDVIDVTPETKYYVMLGAFVLVTAIAFLMVWSNFGLRLLAIREDEMGAESLGISPSLAKISALGISGACTGLFGGIFAWTQGFLSPEAFFAPRWSMEMVVMAIVGGLGTVLGPIFGGLVFFLLPELLISNGIILKKRDETYLVFLGGILIVTMLFLRRGVIGTLQASRHWPKGFRA